MREVAILGAGPIGGSVAQMLARLDVVATIRLIDESGAVAQGKALDIMQSAGLEGFSTTVVGTTELSAGGRASMVVLADCAHLASANRPAAFTDAVLAHLTGEDP